jgi:hypothetical protein
MVHTLLHSKGAVVSSADFGSCNLAPPIVARQATIAQSDVMNAQGKFLARLACVTRTHNYYVRLTGFRVD